MFIDRVILKKQLGSESRQQELMFTDVHENFANTEGRPKCGFLGNSECCSRLLRLCGCASAFAVSSQKFIFIHCQVWQCLRAFA